MIFQLMPQACRPRHYSNVMAHALPALIALTLLTPQIATAQSGFVGLRKLEQQGASVSALAVDLSNGRVIAEQSSEKRLSPASTTKLITAAAYLSKFGSDHSFITKLWTDGSIKNGTLTGNLIFEGAGDPYLTNEKIWFLTTDVARRGIKKVTGKLILNNSAFGEIPRDSNRAAGKNSSRHAYDSPLSASAVNFSTMAVVVAPDGVLATEPSALESAILRGKVTTGAASRVQVVRNRFGDKDVLDVSGGTGGNPWPTRIYRSVSDADQYTAAVLRSFLSQAGVQLMGGNDVQTSAVPESAIPVAQISGFPVDWQLQGLFKVSNNFIADMMTIHLDNKTPPTLNGGSENLAAYLKSVVSKADPNADVSGIRLDSGSGLTPTNRVSAKDLVTLLTSEFSNMRDFPAYLSALPIPGAEGTVRKRFSSDETKRLQELVRAKTGTLSEPYDAIALAGYSRNKNGGWVAFACIVNGSREKPSYGTEAVRDIIDNDLSKILP